MLLIVIGAAKDSYKGVTGVREMQKEGIQNHFR